MPKALRRQLLASTAAGVLAFAGAMLATSVQAAEFFAGGYSFSDELGGFRLLSASGTGTSSDPIVVTEELVDVVPVTLVIRNRDFRKTQGVAQPQLTLVKRVVNRSRRIWAGFELELQEVLGKPSVYGDGLSFKQFASEPPDVASDAFLNNERRFEPFDRIEFSNGHVDPDATVTFTVTITDPTPVREYYLVQDPKLVFARLPAVYRFAAKR